MRNGNARFNLNAAAVVGPRATLIVALLHECKAPMSSGQVARAFKLGTACRVAASLASLVRKGLASRAVTGTAKDGGAIGATFALTADGLKLARRMQKVTGLGNNFSLVRGRR